MRTGILLLVLASLATSVTSGAMLRLKPSNGVITGLPGQDVGWGFEIENTNDFLVVEGSDFCLGLYTTPCVNPYGLYTSNEGSAFIVVGPAPESTIFSQEWDGSGIGILSIESTPPGHAITGRIFLSYSLYSRSPNDPDFSPFTDLISTGNLLSAPATVLVGIPEPGTIMLVALPLLVCLMWRLFFDRQGRCRSGAE